MDADSARLNEPLSDLNQSLVDCTNFTNTTTVGCTVSNTSESIINTEEFWELTLSVKLWQIIPPLLLAVGLTGNVLVLAVLRKMHFTKSVALLFFFVMAVSDSTVLVVVLLRYWLLMTFDVDIRTISDAGCKIIFFLTYFSMQFSSWLLAAVTLERCIVIRFSLRAQVLVTVKRARVALLVIVVILTLTNGYLLFTQRIKDDSCGSFEKDYIYFFDENIFIWIDLLMLCVIPFCVMLVCNIIIVREYKGNVSRHDKLTPSNGACKPKDNSKKVSSITLMLLAVNFYFLATTIPISVYFVLDTFFSSAQDDPTIAAKMELAWTICYLLQFTNYGLNFYLYVARGRRFRVGFLKLFKRDGEIDSMLDSRRQTYADVSLSTAGWKKHDVTETSNLARRSTMMVDSISTLRNGKPVEFRSVHPTRRSTVAEINGGNLHGNSICNM